MNKRLIVSMALLVALLGLFGQSTAGVGAAPNASALVINEVYAPSFSGFASQYFELYNGTTATVNLANYTIYNSGGSDSLGGLPNTILLPGQYMTIAGSNLGGTIGSGLNPASDFLALKQTTPSDVTVDVVNWGRVDPSWLNYPTFQQYFWVSNAPSMPTDGNRSLQRYPSGYDTDQPSDWVGLPQTPAQPPPSYTPTATVAPSATSTRVPGSTPSPTPYCGDAYEPDGIPEQARPIDLGTEQTHSICPSGDNDWFQISVVSNKVYTLYTKDLGGGLDTLLSVYDSRIVKIAENDDAPGCLCSRIDMSFPVGGTYYVRVKDNRTLGGLGWVYTIGFTATAGPAPSTTPLPTATPDPFAPTATPISGPCLDSYEPDGIPASAHLLLIGEIQPGHNFCPGGDADWYRFFGGRGKAYTIQTYGLGIGVDTYLYLFDSDGTTILAQNDDVSAPPSPNPNDVVASSLDFFPVRDDFYYIMVKNKGDLGSPNMVYNVSQKVRANVPPPAGSATPIIAPIVTITAAVPPTAPAATLPPTAPAATPPPITTLPPPVQTQGVPTAAVPPTVVPQPTEPPAAPPPVADTATPVPPTATPAIEPGAGGLPTVEPIPLPQTGHAPAAPAMISMPVGVYLDRNGNGRYDKGEGISSLRLLFQDAKGARVAATTNNAGMVSALLPRDARATLSIPYLHWSGSLKVDAAGSMIRMPRPVLPTRIP
ncbi:MAG TPA: lamin tail domain-containing protein [Chloroflexia bacterium]|nr:lamin tail domain-containing protein [Chloroflexia bacterium]